MGLFADGDGLYTPVQDRTRRQVQGARTKAKEAFLSTFYKKPVQTLTPTNMDAISNPLMYPERFDKKWAQENPIKQEMHTALSELSTAPELLESLMLTWDFEKFIDPNVHDEWMKTRTYKDPLLAGTNMLSFEIGVPVGVVGAGLTGNLIKHGAQQGISRALYHGIEPYGYNIRDAIKNMPVNWWRQSQGKLKIGARENIKTFGKHRYKIRDDVFRTRLGLPQKNNSLIKTGENTYAFNQELFDSNRLYSMLHHEWSPVASKLMKKRKQITLDNTFGSMAKYSRTRDPKTGLVSYFDIWDINPFQKLFTKKYSSNFYKKYGKKIENTAFAKKAIKFEPFTFLTGRPPIKLQGPLFYDKMKYNKASPPMNTKEKQKRVQQITKHYSKEGKKEKQRREFKLLLDIQSGKSKYSNLFSTDSRVINVEETLKLYPRAKEDMFDKFGIGRKLYKVNTRARMQFSILR